MAHHIMSGERIIFSLQIYCVKFKHDKDKVKLLENVKMMAVKWDLKSNPHKSRTPSSMQ